MTSEPHPASEFDAKAEGWDDHADRVARAADVARQIMARIGPAPTMDVLDFGCGTGLLGFQLLPHVASVTFADTSAGMLRQVQIKLAASRHQGGRTLLLGREPALPRSYDAIVSLMTLHHVADPEATLRLLAHHLAPGGWLAVCDLDTEDGTFHEDPDADVHHGFDRQALVSMMGSLELQEARATTAFVMHRDGPDGTRPFPLFLLTARRRT